MDEPDLADRGRMRPPMPKRLTIHWQNYLAHSGDLGECAVRPLRTWRSGQLASSSRRQLSVRRPCRDAETYRTGWWQADELG
jgi:hypothetical protein